MPAFAIDFGTTNSAIALATDESVSLMPIEAEATTMPTAVFYFDEDGERSYGRAAIADYVSGHEGRLMRSMKSVLGSSLMDATTIVGGAVVPYVAIIAGYLRHLKLVAESRAGLSIDTLVLGRPVFFVDDDARRDAAAQASLVEAASAIGSRDIAFQFEPVAAALDYEATLDRERLVMVADIGGGTSDFCVLRASPAGRTRVDRHDDILGSYGVHIAGTDFDRAVELAAILGELGHRSTTTGGRAMPSRNYYDLATWHLINTLYSPKRVAEFEGMSYLFADPAQHRRLMKVIHRRLGHALAGAAELLKIEVADGSASNVALDEVEAGLVASFDEAGLARETGTELDRIAEAAIETARLAGVAPASIETLYLTGGSTGIRLLVDRLQRAFPNAETVRGDRFASVASGLGLQAQRIFC
ncbi:Hsp70 family protein [soil metagenome]